MHPNWPRQLGFVAGCDEQRSGSPWNCRPGIPAVNPYPLKSTEYQTYEEGRRAARTLANEPEKD